MKFRTDELSLIFCQVTRDLCPDVQRLIWEEVLYCSQPTEAPPAPRKNMSMDTPLRYEPTVVSSYVPTLPPYVPLGLKHFTHVHGKYGRPPTGDAGGG